MSYNNRTDWKDHVVERPRTYTEVSNPDNSKTFTPSPGEIYQQGTPQSATNFNKIEEALQHISTAYDMLLTITQLEIRDSQERISELEEQLAELTS